MQVYPLKLLRIIFCLLPFIFVGCAGPRSLPHFSYSTILRGTQTWIGASNFAGHLLPGLEEDQFVTVIFLGTNSFLLLGGDLAGGYKCFLVGGGDAPHAKEIWTSKPLLTFLHPPDIAFCTTAILGDDLPFVAITYSEFSGSHLYTHEDKFIQVIYLDDPLLRRGDPQKIGETDVVWVQPPEYTAKPKYKYLKSGDLGSGPAYEEFCKIGFADVDGNGNVDLVILKFRFVSASVGSSSSKSFELSKTATYVMYYEEKTKAFGKAVEVKLSQSKVLGMFAMSAFPTWPGAFP